MYLLPGEVTRGEWRRHWIDMLGKRVYGPVAAIAVVGFGFGVLTGGNWLVFGLTTALATITATVLVAWRFPSWYCDRFVLTDQRLIVITGIRSRAAAAVPLARAADMSYRQTPAGRFLVS